MINKKRTVAKKTTNRKKVLTLKNKTMFALVKNIKGTMYCMTELKDHANHAVNSYLAHMGKESHMKDLLVAEIKIIGTPVVKTTRNITIKK